MKNNFTYTIIWLVIAALSVNLVIFFVGQKKTSPITHVRENNSRENKMEATMLKQFEVEHRKLFIPPPLVDSLQNYMKNNTLLIFHFDSYACDACVNNAITDLISFKEKIGKQHILVIVSEDNQKRAMILMSGIKEHFNTIWIKNNEMQFEDIAENLPIHFFLLDRTMIPFCLYFYMPEFPTFNREYFGVVADRISQR